MSEVIDGQFDAAGKPVGGLTVAELCHRFESKRAPRVGSLAAEKGRSLVLSEVEGMLRPYESNERPANGKVGAARYD
jgi:hypothetical protein